MHGSDEKAITETRPQFANPQHLQTLLVFLDLGHMMKTALPIPPRTLSKDAMTPSLRRHHLSILKLPRSNAVVERRGHEVDLYKLGLVVDLVCRPGLVAVLHVFVERGLGAG